MEQQNRLPAKGHDLSTKDTLAAIGTAIAAALVFGAGILVGILPFLAILAALLLAENVVPGISGVALAAFCIWLIVRIVNRRGRKRWANWPAVALAMLALMVAVLAGLARLIEHAV